MQNRHFSSGFCAPKQYLCYRSYQTQPDDVARQIELYAAENSMEAVEIPAYCSDVPLVHIPKEPLTLTAEVKNFFYGESADDDLFCAFTYDDNAPDLGFPEWHVPCGEFCAMSGGKYEITASSELASQDDKYAARNLVYGRETAWAEGVPGYGIGESVDVHFEFVIEEVYPGTKYEDTCLTGLVAEFMGRHGH